MSTVESPSGPLPIDNQKERLRIYTDYAPAMLAYKEEIYKCVYEDDHDFILQRMPEKPDQIQYKATCGHMYCKAENGVFEFNTYRVSIERKNNNDPANPLRQCIPLQPLHKISPALMKCKLVSPVTLSRKIFSAKYPLSQGPTGCRSVVKGRTTSIGFALCA